MSTIAGAAGQDLIRLVGAEALTFEFAALRAGAHPDGACCTMLAEAYLGKQDATAGVLGDVPEDEPPVSVPRRVERGEVWQLGRHRLMCGDSADAGAVSRLMDGALADIVFTSPPYDQQRDYGAKIYDWQGLMRGVFSALPVKDDAQILVNLGLVHRDGEWVPYWDPWIEWMREQGRRRFSLQVWDKMNGFPVDPRIGRPNPAFELIFQFHRKPRAINKTAQSATAGRPHPSSKTGGIAQVDGANKRAWSHAGELTQPTRIPDDVWRIQRHKSGGVDHPAVFPVRLPAEMYAAFSDEGDIAYEPFLGSGTSIIAGEHTGRIVYGADIEPTYCDIALARWERLTGQKATRL